MTFYDNKKICQTSIKSVQNVSRKKNFFVKVKLFIFIESDSVNV